MSDEGREDRDEDRTRYEELLQELRVMLPGVEVLFAFLLTSVFANRFEDLDRLGRSLFIVSLLTAAVTVLVLLVPAFLHRIADIERSERIRLAARFQVAGSLTLGVSMAVAVFVVIRFVFTTSTALWLTGLVAVLWLALWYLFPLVISRSTARR